MEEGVLHVVSLLALKVLSTLFTDNALTGTSHTDPGQYYGQHNF